MKKNVGKFISILGSALVIGIMVKIFDLKNLITFSIGMGLIVGGIFLEMKVRNNEKD